MLELFRRIVPASVFTAAAVAQDLRLNSAALWCGAIAYGVIGQVLQTLVLDLGERVAAGEERKFAYIGHAIAVQSLIALGVLQLVVLGLR